MNYHQTVSFVKSGLRIVGFLLLLESLLGGIILLIVAEVLGIIEELE